MAYKNAYVWNGTSWDSIGNQAVSSLNDYLTIVSASATYATKEELGGAGLNPFFLPGI